MMIVWVSTSTELVTAVRAAAAAVALLEQYAAVCEALG